MLPSPGPSLKTASVGLAVRAASRRPSSRAVSHSRCQGTDTPFNEALPSHVVRAGVARVMTKK